MASFAERLKRGWNVFRDRDEKREEYTGYRGFEAFGMSSSYRPDRIKLTRGNERSVITAIINRIAIDSASVDIRHVKLDENDRYVETIKDSLNDALTIDANVDQTGFAMRLDMFMSLMDEGVIAIVPTDWDDDPENGGRKIGSIRVGQIIEWFPLAIKVRLYNQKRGIKEDIVLPKDYVAIVENPFYSIMNEPNSTFKRLVRKLNLLDLLDGQASSGKLDLIIQLPYTIKSELKKEQAEKRRKDIEVQLTNSKYGIAYTDATEKITQLNRAVDNNILPQIEFLTKQLMDQLGITSEIMNGTAEDVAMLNYHQRICVPLLTAVTDEMKRKFLTKTARSQGQSILFFRDPFKLVPVDKLAEIADRFTRNEILSSNEVRAIIGFKPSKDPRADELRNKNINQPDEAPKQTPIENKNEEDNQNA